MPTLKQNALVALPFFPEESYQTFRHPAADDVWESLAILSPRDKLVPIIIQRTPAATPSKIYLCAAEAKVALDITLLVGGGSTATIDGKGWFYNSGATLGASECPKVAGTGSNPIAWGASSGDQTIDEFIATYPYVYLDIQIGTSRFFSELLYMADVPEFPELTDGCGNFAYVRLEAITACNIGTYFPAELDVNNTVYIKNGGDLKSITHGSDTISFHGKLVNVADNKFPDLPERGPIYTNEWDMFSVNSDTQIQFSFDNGPEASLVNVTEQVHGALDSQKYKDMSMMAFHTYAANGVDDLRSISAYALEGKQAWKVRDTDGTPYESGASRILPLPMRWIGSDWRWPSASARTTGWVVSCSWMA